MSRRYQSGHGTVTSCGGGRRSERPGETPPPHESAVPFSTMRTTWIAALLVSSLGCGGTSAAPIDCKAGQTACGGKCVDVSSDAQNCGACGRDCLGGACQANVCQVATVAQPGGDPYGLALDSTSVYFTTVTTGNVYSCPLAGCGASPTTLATGLQSPSGIASDGKNVYIATLTSVLSCPVTGCGASPAVFAANQGDPSVVVVDATRVYWTNHTGNQVMSCPIAGCAGQPTVISPNETAAEGLAIDGTNAYWTNAFTPGGTVNKCPLAGCGGLASTVLTTGLSLPQSIVTDGKNVYFTVYSGNAVMSCPVSGCGATPTPLITLSGAYDGIAVDGTDLYVVNGFDDGSVLKCATTGCPGGPTVLATKQGKPGKIAVNARAIYWTASKSGTVMVLAK